MTFRLSLSPATASMLLLASLISAQTDGVHAQRPVVPGTGEKVEQVGDNFEKEGWKFIFNYPKSSKDIDEYVRLPAGRSKNGRWYEGNKRGCPDVIRRVRTPKGGLPGSKYSLLLRTLRSGVPGQYSGKWQQDDLIVNVKGRLHGHIPIRWSPSIVTRVFLPPVDTWENRSGILFGFRGDVQAYTKEESKGLLFFAPPKTILKEYWPGIFIYFTSKTDSGQKSDSAYFIFRAGPTGHDFKGPSIKQTGWWTLGLSFTPDGQVHYYVSPGVDDLTKQDYVTSRFPYDYRCDRLNNFFFNITNMDNGRTWSSKWIIDDPSLYIIRDDYASKNKSTKRMARKTPAKPQSEKKQTMSAKRKVRRKQMQVRPLKKKINLRR